MQPIPTRLQQLYDAAKRIGQHFDRSVEAVFDPCGLILQQPPIQGYYWCTPSSAYTFASTGGDGVHYSYLQAPDVALDATPIVMTMPANDQLNYVLAEGIDEFLGLGFHVGWFALEQVAYSPEWASQYFAGKDSDASQDMESRLSALRRELSMRYVPLELARIDALFKKYAAHLQVPPEPQ